MRFLRIVSIQLDGWILRQRETLDPPLLVMTLTFLVAVPALVPGPEAVAGGVRVVVDALPPVDAGVVLVTLVCAPEGDARLLVERGLQRGVPREEPHLPDTPDEVIGRTLQQGDRHTCKIDRKNFILRK